MSSPLELALQAAIAASQAAPTIIDWMRSNHPELMTEPLPPLRKTKAARDKALRRTKPK